LTDKPAKGRGFLTDVISVLFGKSFHVVLTLISGIILARALGPEGKGIVASILVYPMLFQSLFEGGLRQSAIYFLGQKKNAMEDILGAMALGYVTTSMLGAIGCYYSIAFFVPTELPWHFIIAISLIVPAQIGISYTKGFLLGIGKIDAFSKATWFPALFLLVTLLLLLIGPGLTVGKALLATVGAAYLGFFQALWFLFANVTFTFNVNGSLLWQMLRLGCVYAVALFSITLNYRIDVALLSIWSTADAIGIYSVSTNIGELLWYLPGVLVPLIFSRSANAGGTGHIENLARIVKYGFPASCLMAVLFGVAGLYLIPVFYGVEFSASSYALILLLPGLTAMILFKILNADLAGQGDPVLALVAMVPGVLINVVLNFFLIPPYGASGAAVASTVSYLVASFIFLLGYTRKRNVSLKYIFRYSSDDIAWVRDRLTGITGKIK
jgi:O-antigen/teichoic acid export membrane protein